MRKLRLMVTSDSVMQVLSIYSPNAQHQEVFVVAYSFVHNYCCLL